MPRIENLESILNSFGARRSAFASAYALIDVSHHHTVIIITIIMGFRGVCA